jgi:hypothetical protein
LFPLGAQGIRETLVSRQFLNLRQPVGLLGRGISPSQGLYLHTNTEKSQTNIHAMSGIRTHDPSFEQMKIFHALDRAAIVIGILLNAIQEFSSYLSGNTSSFCYNNQPVNAV